MDPKIEILIKQMEQARLQLNTALDKLAPQAEVYPTWKLKQVLDHITGWDELINATIRTYQKGEIPARSVKGINQFNNASVSIRQTLTLEQSRQVYDAIRQEMLQTLRKLPAGMFDQEFKAPWVGKCTIAGILKIFTTHEQEHARQIEEILVRNAPNS